MEITPDIKPLHQDYFLNTYFRYDLKYLNYPEFTEVKAIIALKHNDPFCYFKYRANYFIHLF